jgi:hypothetical protein
MQDEYSPGGSKIYRHSEKKLPEDFDNLGESSLDQIDAHIEKWLGRPSGVFHELVSPTIHVDVHLVPPTADRDFNVLVSSGMSDKAMNGPFPDLRFAELVLLLPPDWPLDQESFEKEQNFWPIRQMKYLARFPHDFSTWIWETHTIPNGDPPQPYVPNTELCCILLANPISLPYEFRTLTIGTEKTIHFFALIPIYQDEMHYKLKKGIEALYECFGKAGVTEVIDTSRPCCVKLTWFNKLLG